jgi:F-type H+-transporting ATPase subunit delta
MKAGRRVTREARQLLHLCVVDDQLDEQRVRQLVPAVIASHRSDRLAVLTRFQRLVRLERERRTATVGTPTAVPDDIRSVLEWGLTRRYGKGLAIDYELDPDLIGGLRIKVGSDVYDGSVKGRLAALARQFSTTSTTAT